MDKTCRTCDWFVPCTVMRCAYTGREVKPEDQACARWVPEYLFIPGESLAELKRIEKEEMQHERH